MPDALPVARLVVMGIVGLGLLVGTIAGAAYLFGDQLAEIGKGFVRTLGGPGVSLGYILADALTVPLPAELVATFALMGGMSFVEVCAWGCAGSLVGGSVGWVIGAFLAARWPGLDRRIKNDTRVVPFLERNMVAVLAIAAVTPLPYSVSAWGVGALRMPYSTFIFVSLLRIPRVVGYLWLVKEGVVAVGGL